MKIKLILLLALLASVPSYAYLQTHDGHNAIFKGSSNKLFTALNKQEEQALSKVNPIEQSNADAELLKRERWVNINIAEIDALRTYVIDVLAKAENSQEFESWQAKNFEGDTINVRVKNHLDFPVDINFNFFDDIQFGNRFLGDIVKTTTADGNEYYTITLSQRHRSLPAITLTLRDKLTIHAKTWDSYIMLEQAGEHAYRIYEQKKPKLIEGKIETPPNKPSQEVPSQKKFDGSALMLNTSNKRIIDVLVLFDNHSNQSISKNSTVLPGVTLMNRLLTDSNVNANVNIVAFDKLPASICGGNSNVCYSSYESHLTEITASKDVLNLRLKHGADAAVILRSTKHGDLSHQTLGIANLADPSDPFQADKTYALVYYSAGAETFAHELAHVFGADHSSYNSLPGTPPAVAQLTFYDDKQNQPYHKDAVKTFMTYKYVCDSELNKVNAANPGKSKQKCISVERFSAAVQYPAPWTTTPVMLGSHSKSNRNRVDDVTYRAHGWNTEIINHKPIPKINFVDVPLVTGLPHCFNAVGTTDPDGDRIVRFYWFVRKYGDHYNKLKEAEYATAASTFCWTPTLAQRGDYMFGLSVRDEKGADKLVGKKLHIVYDPDYISAPELYLHKTSSSEITLSWSKPIKGNVGYYHIEKKIGDGGFMIHGSSWDTMEDISLDTLGQGDNYFRVQGCKLFGSCGSWSNVLHYNPRGIH